MIALPTQDAVSLLQHLLRQAGWRSNDAAVCEAIPHMSEALSSDDMLESLRNLKIPVTEVRCRERDITAAECPALVFPDGGDPFAVFDARDGQLTLRDASGDTDLRRAPGRAWCRLVRIDRSENELADSGIGSVRDAFSALQPMMPWLLISSFLVNVLGLLAPLLIMGIYDRVIPSGSSSFLTSIAIGVCVVLVTDFVLRQTRSKAIAYIGKQAELSLSQALFAKLMALPLTQLQKSDTDQQISRFRQFEALREIFTGQVLTSILDLPFALIFLCLLLYLAPAVGILALCVAVFFLLHSAVTVPIQQRLDHASSEANAASRALFHDAVAHQRAVSDLGLGQVWLRRSAPLVSAAETATQKARQFQMTQQLLVQSVNGLATVFAIIISAYGALGGSMSFGVLIAVITLVSKILAPFHALHANLPQILSFLRSRDQADRVLALTEEMELGLGRSHKKTLTGAVNFHGVTHRPDPLNAPVLSQVSFRIEPGECVLIMASEVATRTAVLDLIDGFATPLGGSIEHDDIDIRQIARDELRRSVTYTTYEVGLFYGTIAQNFRLAAPLLSDAEIQAAIATIAIDHKIAALPEGVATRLTDAVLAQLPPDVQRGLALARSVARTSPLHLFSDPTNELSETARAAFKRWVEAQKGIRTVVVSTSDRSFIDLADRFIYLEAGRVTVNDVGEVGRKKLQAVLNKAGKSS